MVTLLDIVVAAAWYTLFKPVNRRLSAVAACIRMGYTGLFMVAAGHLVSAFTLLGEPSLSLKAIAQFNSMWLISLGLFGIHLLLIGCLAVRSGSGSFGFVGEVATIFWLLIRGRRLTV